MGDPERVLRLETSRKELVLKDDADNHDKNNHKSKTIESPEIA